MSESTESTKSTSGRAAAVASGDYETQLYTGVTPARIFDTRPSGVTQDGLFANTGKFAGSRDVQVTGRGGVPTGAGAVVVNLTVTNPTHVGYTTVFPTGTTRPNASNLNFVAGATVANAVVAKLSATGSLTIYNMAVADVIVDVSGWLPADADYTSLNPARLTDTRPNRKTIDNLETGKGAYTGNRAVKVTGRGGVPALGVGSVVLNVTSTRAALSGYTTVYPTGETRPTTSNVNFTKNLDKASLVIAKVGSDGTIQMFNSARTDLVVDVMGWFPAESDFTGFKPARLVDTRSGRSTIDGNDLGDGSFSGPRSYQVAGRDAAPTRSSAVVLNVTVTEPINSGYTTVFSDGDARPVASNLNFNKGQTTANLVVATVGLSGRITIYNSTGTHLVVDVFGWLPGFVPTKGDPSTTQISVAPDGAGGTIDSVDASLSGNGRFTAYASRATNLVADDTNGYQDVFVHDSQTKVTTRVSVGSAGLQGDRDSGAPNISADGRYVVFESAARNLVDGDLNNKVDIFVHDRDTATTSRASVASSGVESNDTSLSPSISDDGRYIAFSSEGTNLVVGDTNSSSDVFVRDTINGSTSRTSLSSSAAQGDDASSAPMISGDGNSVVFQSFATDLVIGDTNGHPDVFHRNLPSGTTTLVSRSSAGIVGDGISESPDVSNDGRLVVFRSTASNLVSGDVNSRADVFLRDTVTDVTTRVSIADGGLEADDFSAGPAISGNGRFVAYSSVAKNLVSGDSSGWEDVFVLDVEHLVTSRVSLGLGGLEANNPSYRPTISSDGRYIAFGSNASNLVDSGDGSKSQVYLTRSPARS
ncbi:MAG: hypothetical protein WBA45_10715 [Microthrixaceae bacterium]